MRVIEIEKENLPEIFDIELGVELFTLEIDYNEAGDFFTVDLYQYDNPDPLVLGEKLMLNQPLFRDIEDGRFPAPTLIPVDPSGKESRITWENFGVTVFLVVDDGDDNE
ncbi:MULTISPECIES: phage baseplate plug family protein [Aeribacillus]|uniref:Cyanophage baseplate Pam3 plug gp18 domain-containing protein n=2 Tax=root TaxID=1 RepID=A0A161ZSV1_9BACI|nr:hypothetical protein [Aeribacillus pallidus]YP_009831970.1 hypothetical protein HWD36_gp57 [Aeribacillus phage AP45]APC46506.1 hypothetical protein [Aeribacillus phage AP45]KZN96167.1 hypothetical protein AZI98_08880 [Aeribacillus pallidus]